MIGILEAIVDRESKAWSDFILAMGEYAGMSHDEAMNRLRWKLNQHCINYLQSR